MGSVSGQEESTMESTIFSVAKDGQDVPIVQLVVRGTDDTLGGQDGTDNTDTLGGQDGTDSTDTLGGIPLGAEVADSAEVAG